MAPTTTILRMNGWGVLTMVTVLANICTASFLITLSEVEIITAIAAPIGCVLAYNTPIFACDVQDFTGSNSCSVQCERALEAVQENIQGSCSQIMVPKDSLMYQAQHGNLVKALCDRDTNRPSSIPTQPPANTPTSSTTSLLRFTVSDCTTPLDVTVTATTTQTRRITVMPPPSPSTTEISSTEASATEASTTEISTTKVSSTKKAETSTLTSTSTKPPPAKTTTLSEAPSSATQVASDAEASSTASANKEKPTTAVYRGGGGTPFDNNEPISGAGRVGFSAGGLACVVAGAALLMPW